MKYMVIAPSMFHYLNAKSEKKRVQIEALILIGMP